MLMLSVPVSPVELARARIGHHHDREGWRTALHASRVLQHEAALAPVERACDLVDGHVTRGAFDGGACGQHVPTRRGIEIAAEFLGEQETAQHADRAETSAFASGCTLTSKLPDARFMSTFHVLYSGSLKFGFSMMPNTLPPRIEHVGHANAFAHVLDIRARLGAELEQPRTTRWFDVFDAPVRADRGFGVHQARARARNRRH